MRGSVFQATPNRAVTVQPMSRRLEHRTDRFITRTTPFSPQRIGNGRTAKAKYHKLLGDILSAASDQAQPIRMLQVNPPPVVFYTPQYPTHILDAPCMGLDGYLLAWSSTNILAVGLGVSVYTGGATV